MYVYMAVHATTILDLDFYLYSAYAAHYVYIYIYMFIYNGLILVSIECSMLHNRAVFIKRFKN